jgi:hypothetical protein
MRTSKQSQTEPTAAAQLEMARDELQAAQNELQAFDIHKGALNEAASRRRELSERVEIAKERLTLAQSRFDEAEFGRIENEIAELQADARRVENEIAAAREQAEADLRQHLNPDWLAGTGRFASCPPAIHGLLGFCNSVSEVEGRRDAVQAAIRSRENRIAERRAQRDRERRAAEVEGRKNLIAGGTVEIPLTPWKIIPSPGFTSDIMDNLERRAIPSALPDPRQPEIHALLPPDSKPHNWADGFQIESAEPMPPAELCPAMAAVWQRATPSKKRAAR